MTDKYNVAEVSFNSNCLVVFILYLQVEAYYYLCYNNFIFFNKTLRVAATQKVNHRLMNYTDNKIYFVFFLLSVFFYKHNIFVNCGLVLLSTLFLTLLIKVLHSVANYSSSNNTIYLILPSFVTLLYLLFFVKTLLVFFFFVEVYSVFYYFCFLSSYNFTNQTLLKYKNGILFLLWNNFLTTVFLVLGCFLTLKATGTTDFYELSLIISNLPCLYFFIVGLFWKLGLPVFHFLKLEVYKYLLRENVFLFSILTTLVNVIILFIALSQPIILNTFLLHNWIVVILAFTILLSLVNLNLSNILQFFAFSSLFTMSTVLTVFVI